jgi:hypothetical protein
MKIQLVMHRPGRLVRHLRNFIAGVRLEITNFRENRRQRMFDWDAP